MRNVMSSKKELTPDQLANSDHLLRIKEICSHGERRERIFKDKNGNIRKIKGKPAKKGLLPLGESTIWEMVRKGEFPKPIKLSDRITVWKSSDILQWMKSRNLV